LAVLECVGYDAAMSRSPSSVGRGSIVVIVCAAVAVLGAGCSGPTPDPDGGTTAPEHALGPATSVGRGVPGSARLSRIAFDPGRAFVEVRGATRPGHVSRHVFSGETGQVVLLSFARRPSGVLAMSVRGPDGEILVDAAEDAVLELPSTGDYEVGVVGGDEPYTLLATRSSGTTRATPSVSLEVEDGVTHEGSLARGEIAQLSFAATSGTDVAVRATSTDGQVLASVRRVGGPILVSFGEAGYAAGAEIVRRIPESGTYTVSILSLGGLDPASDTSYALRIEPVVAP
jgi:hypothetical protein